MRIQHPARLASGDPSPSAAPVAPAQPPGQHDAEHRDQRNDQGKLIDTKIGRAFSAAASPPRHAAVHVGERDQHVPPMIATRPSVCMVVCMDLRSAWTDCRRLRSEAPLRPSSRRRRRPARRSRSARARWRHVPGLDAAIARIASVWPSRPIMIRRLA